jgi:hypothetical protein
VTPITSTGGGEALARWLTDLESRHLADLTFSEVSRALRALSSAYVERRARLGEGAALSGAGKRAAFALFYGPLHYLLLHHVMTSLAPARRTQVVDLGCGTGAAAAAWIAAVGGPATIVGVDRHPWAIDEARRTYGMFGQRAQVRRDLVARSAWPARSVVLLAFTVNELDDGDRARLLERLIDHGRAGGAALVVEPLAKFVAPWWPSWRDAFQAAGGRSDEWRLRTTLPPLVQKLDEAAGLNHREITGRSLFLR